MRLRILAIGRLRSGPLKDLQTFYAVRIIPPPAVIEFDVKQRLPPAMAKAREAELILKALPIETPLIALAERGTAWSSRELADRLGQWRDRGTAELAFAIGGAEGLAATVLDRAAAVLSLGPMTWPHLLVRGMLLEQLYRAQQILAGHPYHRE
ncbi:MAG: 23S rRNA (pseudouridine(1915)-N(3))-methyltransferase RlmH [Alphaproteobacteria bacterium]|nr:23S rRNA (pseudouridine(1915)-N(3))-methyltransferase RlmH [Alphaproteobacteria bacterium]